MNDAKLIGGLGSVLMILGLVHFAIGIIGLVLVLIAVKMLSDSYAEERIFRHAIFFVIFSMAGVAVFWISVLAAIPLVLLYHNLTIAVMHMILGLVIAFVLFVVSALFFRKCFNRIAELTGVNLFATAAMLYLIGSILMIVFVGFILIVVSEVLLAVAFFSLPE